MPNPFAALNAALFANTDLARAAVYTPPAGSPVSITVIPSLQDPDAQGPGRGRRNIMVLEVRVSELAAPVEGATVVTGGVTYKVYSRPAYADDERLTWRLEAFEVLPA